MLVVGGGDTVEGDGEDLVHYMRGKELGGESGESGKFEHKSKIFQIWTFNMSRDQYSHMRQQFCGMNNYCDARGSIYLEIKKWQCGLVWRQIHHSSDTLPCNHDLPHLCDFPDDVSSCIYPEGLNFELAKLINRLPAQSRLDRLEPCLKVYICQIC